jgi:hypothetical protein
MWKTHELPYQYNRSVCTKPGKWVVMYLCVLLEVSILHLSTIFLFDFGSGPTVWYFLGLHFITCLTWHEIVDMSWYKQGKLATSIIFDFSVLFQNYNQVSNEVEATSEDLVSSIQPPPSWSIPSWYKKMKRI